MSKAAEVIRKYKSEIIDHWENAVKDEVQASKTTSSLVLRNILPNLLDDFIIILENYDERDDDLDPQNYDKIVQDSIDHGRHRATSSDYTVDQLIKEYMVLHRVIIRQLKDKDAFDEEVSILLAFTLETSMSYSVGSFSEALQHMREKLIGTLAHDIRNPLSAAYLANDAQSYQHGEERLNKLKDLTSKNIRRSLDMLEGLLEAITVQAGQGITLNFSDHNIVEDIKLVHWEAKEIYSNNIHLNLEEEEINGVFDPNAVRRLLENLLTNAVKYGSRDQPINVSLEDREQAVSLKVHNHGEPISPEDQEKMFDFLNKRDQRSGEGLQSWGIGLTFVKMAAEAHGGQVEIESEKEKGTTFHVLLQKYANEPGKKQVRINYGI